MDGYIATFKSFAGATKSSPKGPEDYIDKLNYQITPSILLIIATIVGMRQYVFQAIQCWTKKELDSSREEYAENYCWIQSTFYFSDDEAIPHADDPGRGQRIYYYQWIPFILMGQAVMFYIPHLIWIFLSSNTGVNVKDIMLYARGIHEERKRTSGRESCQRDQKLCTRCVNFFFGKPTFAMYLIVVYFFVKLVYISNCVGQLYLMRSYLGLNMTNFGLQIMGDIANNRTWETTNVFPRVTYCKFQVRDVGVMQPYVLQCVLPVNMLNEKFYIFIWFWVMLLLMSNISSLLRWLMRNIIGPNRKRVVKKLLKIASTMDDSFERERFLEKDFVRSFLETDGIFVLSMISSNSGDVTAAEVVKEVWKSWRSRQKLDSQFVSDEKMPLDMDLKGRKGVIV